MPDKMHLPSLLPNAALLLAALLWAVPTQAMYSRFDPPKGCRGEPPAWKYQIHVTPNAGRVCRKLGMGGFGIMLGCTFALPNARKGSPQFLIVAVNRGWVIRHEWGHVNCPKWKH